MLIASVMSVFDFSEYLTPRPTTSYVREFNRRATQFILTLTKAVLQLSDSVKDLPHCCAPRLKHCICPSDCLHTHRPIVGLGSQDVTAYDLGGRPALISSPHGWSGLPTASTPARRRIAKGIGRSRPAAASSGVEQHEAAAMQAFSAQISVWNFL